jgi:hypothetical protein
VGKYCSSRQAKDDNVMHANCVLDTEGYKHTLRISLFFHCNSSYTNELQSYAVRTFPVLFKLTFFFSNAPKPVTFFILFRDELLLVLLLAALTPAP